MSLKIKRRSSSSIAQTITIRGHELIADEDASSRGEAADPTPHDFYDMALGACKALTVLWYARKKGIPVDDVQTVVERDDSGERAGVYKLTARMKISGALTDAQLAELLAVAKKCPVHKLMTTVTTEIDTEMERMP
jgi:putative redox protein